MSRSLTRAGVLPGARARRASPFGSVVTGSLGLPSGLPFTANTAGRLPRYEPDLLSPLTGRRGKCSLPDKEFRYLRTVHSCYYPSVARAADAFLVDSHGRP